jgi:hypothetical protein
MATPERKTVRNSTIKQVLDLADVTMKAANEEIRRFQSTLIEGQSAGAASTLAFGEAEKALENLNAIQEAFDNMIGVTKTTISAAKVMKVDADQLSMDGYTLPAEIPMGD